MCRIVGIVRHTAVRDKSGNTKRKFTNRKVGKKVNIMNPSNVKKYLHQGPYSQIFWSQTRKITLRYSQKLNF